MPRIRHKILQQDISYRVLAKTENGTIPLDMDDAWEAANIVKVHIPQLAGVDDGSAAGCSGYIKLHKLWAVQVQLAFQEIERRGLKNRILSFAGSYYPRMIRGSTKSPSEHSFGTAFDINAGWNGLNRTPAAKGQKGSVIELVPIFDQFGMYWGGHFDRLDGMHFQLLKIIRSQAGIGLPPVAKPSVADTLYVNEKIVQGAMFLNNKWMVPLRSYTQDNLHKNLVPLPESKPGTDQWKVY